MKRYTVSFKNLVAQQCPGVIYFIFFQHSDMSIEIMKKHLRNNVNIISRELSCEAANATVEQLVLITVCYSI